MPRLESNGIQLEYERFGRTSDPLVVLIAGFGEQIGAVEFPHDFCAGLSERGLQVVRFDNRDVGLSTHLNSAGDNPEYTLLDMADDTCGLIAGLGASVGHVVGASMGGFIARWMALRRPEQVASLTLIMTGCGAAFGEDAGQEFSAPSADAIHKMLGKTRPAERSAAIQSYVDAWRTYNGPGFAFDEDWVRSCGACAFDRCYDPGGAARHYQAIQNSPPLLATQEAIGCPTVVIHGDADPLFGVDHADEMGRRIRGARVELVKGMGHEMPREAWPRLWNCIEKVIA